MAVTTRELAKQRVDILRREHPDISLDCIVQDSGYGEWAIILYTEYNFDPMGFDFIESETSWQRPEAIQEYNSLIEEGYCVVVYVPKKVFKDVVDMLRTKGGRSNIRLYSQEKIAPAIMA